MHSLRVAGLFVLFTLTALTGRSDEARAGAWPPAPGADLRDPASWPNDPGYASAWGYWSFLPAQAPGTPAYLGADAALGAAGMSVDRAWTMSTGRSDVVIAVVDSGIAWESPDLLKKAYLSSLELGGKKMPMGPSGPCPGLGGYDCDGDGVFTVSDYAGDPRIAPVVAGDRCFRDPTRQLADGPDRIAGDVNHNCVLDAGDLIALFSDGVDDDSNGYTDDISGWDFVANDNDPYDDTRDGHGTTEALAAVAEGNNGIGLLGVCPRCRGLMLRGGDRVVADANDFGKSVVYAADVGAKVVLAALPTVDMTPFARAAIDYAYGLGVVVVAGNGEDNARHHAWPASANRVVAVHGVTFDGAAFGSSSTFLDDVPCANFGGHVGLSVSAAGCASEAAGRAAGVAGLLYAAALGQATPLALSAEEVSQLLMMTADDVNVPESRAVDTVAGRFYESRPGWDQRFGYGRGNAARALSAVAARLIPPEVEIVSPEWFAPVFADRTSGQVAIAGRVAAARAATYDYSVEWAPGVEPDESAWKPLMAPVTNVPSATVTGGALPLATFDPSQLDTAHTADPDSPHHENDRTITLRVRAVAHYGSIGDQRGEARRTIAIVNARNGLDADLLDGFPFRLGSSIEGGAKLADIDGDHVRDVVVGTSDGLLHVLTLRSGLPVEAPGFPFATLPIDGLNAALSSEPTVPSYLAATAYTKGGNGGVDPAIAREAIVSAPAVADVDGDGADEIAFSTFSGTVYLVDSKGAAVPGWPQRLPLVPSCPLDPSASRPSVCADALHSWARGALASPVLVDMDGDGKLEVVQAAFDGSVYVFRANGAAESGWPVAIHASGAAKRARVLSTPAASDVTGDGVPDLLLGSNEELPGDVAPVFVVDGRGSRGATGAPYVPGWPQSMPVVHPIAFLGEGVESAPAFADFNGDGRVEALVQSNGALPLVVATAAGGELGSSLQASALPIDPPDAFGARSLARGPDAVAPLFSHPSVGDLDQDGTPDVVASGGSKSLLDNLASGASAAPFQHLLAMWSGRTGHMMPGAPVVLEDYSMLSSQAIADVTGDGYPEVIAGTGGYFVHAVDACGREAQGWPKFTGGWNMATPAVGNVDGEGGLEVVAGSREGYLFAWRTSGREDGVVAWESFHHDNANTGDYSRPLDQGALKRAASPIDCTPPAAGELAAYDAGGCGVGRARGGGADGGELRFGGALASLAAWIVKRRRRFACQKGAG